MQRRGDIVQVFRDDLPKNLHVKDIVRLRNEDNEMLMSRVKSFTEFAADLEIVAVVDVTGVVDMPDKKNVKYAQTPGGYALIDADTGARLCTTHSLMSDMGKLAQQKGYIIIGKGELVES